MLLGTSPEEVEVWRAERRKRWPTDANMARFVRGRHGPRQAKVLLQEVPSDACTVHSAPFMPTSGGTRFSRLNVLRSWCCAFRTKKTRDAGGLNEDKGCLKTSDLCRYRMSSWSPEDSHIATTQTWIL